MKRKITLALQRKLWKLMDYMKAHCPSFYNAIKVIFRPMLMWLLTFRQTNPISAKLNENMLFNNRVKISFIILDNNKYISISKIFNTLFFPSKKVREIIIVSSSKKQVDGAPINKIKYASSLANAILSCSGDYLCFIDQKEGFSRMGFKCLYKSISRTKGDLYFGNYTDKTGNLMIVYNQDFSYNFSEAVLPLGASYGPKVISRDLAIKIRLPRESVYSYLLEACDKATNVRHIDYPVVHNFTDDKDKIKINANNIKAQTETLSRRYVYSKKLPIKTISKVLFIAPSVVFGGAEKVLFDLANGLINKGISVDIFCTHGGGVWKKEFEKVGAKIYISKKQSNDEKVVEIDKLVKKNKYDVIHTSNTEYGYYYAPKIMELPYRPIFIDTIHSQNNPLVKIAANYQVYMDKIITVNNYIKKSLKNDIDSEKMVPVLNGVDIRVDNLRDSLSKFNEVEIVFIGRISEEKNPEQFIKIAKNLSEKHTDWKFKVIGDGPLLKKIKQQASRDGIAEKISFLGAVNNGASELASASCSVSTSYTEGLPIVLLEGMSMGIPAVNSNVGGVHEVLSNNKNGYLVNNPDDTAEYVEKIESLFVSFKKYEKFSKAAVESVKNNTATAMTKNVMSVYSDAIKLIDCKFNKLTTIAMLSFNREDATEKTLETIYKTTETPFDVIVLDNGSDKKATDFLKKFAKTHDNFKCIFEKKNLGCPGGRYKMLKMIKSDYIVTIDNDMEVPRFWLRDLIIKMEEDKKIMGVCVKDIFPWGKVEFTGGSIAKDDKGFYLFNAVNYNKAYDDLSTLEEIECDWLPGGATLWRGNIHEVAEHSLEYVNAFEDFDYSLQLTKKHYRTVNCPNVMFIHHHSSGFGKKQKSKEAKYISDRNNENGFIISLAAFFRRTGYIMRNDKIYSLLNISNDATPNEVKGIVESYAATLKRP